MKVLLLPLVFLVSMFTTILSMSAQEVDMCSTENIANRIGEVYNVYSETAQADVESALDQINSFTAEINTIYAECDEARYQAYVPEGNMLLENLRMGGFILYVRHAATDRSQEDTDLAACATQRNLSEQGRIDAANIGAAWASLDIPVSEVMSTEYCRTRETAQLAFGEPLIVPRVELEDTLDDWLATAPEEGTNMIIVGHVDLLEEVTGIRVPEDVRLNEGDALVYRPLGGAMGDGGYEWVTRISFRNWFDLARIVAETP